MIKTLQESVKDPQDCEKTAARLWWDSPTIPFVPPVKDAKLGKEEYVEITLHANVTSSAKDSGSLVKRSVKKFSYGDVEDLLIWRADVEEVRRSKPVSDLVRKFGMIELFLGGDPLATFREIRLNVCMLISVDEDSEPVETKDTFHSTLRRFYCNYFPALGNSVRHQKEYMSQFLRKPCGVLVKQMVARFKQINSYLVFFPEPDNRMLDEASVVEAICNLIPPKWHNDMAKVAFDPTDHSLEELQSTLERIEMIEAMEKLSIMKKIDRGSQKMAPLTSRRSRGRETSRTRSSPREMILHLVLYEKKSVEILHRMAQIRATRRSVLEQCFRKKKLQASRIKSGDALKSSTLWFQKKPINKSKRSSRRGDLVMIQIRTRTPNDNYRK